MNKSDFYKEKLNIYRGEVKARAIERANAKAERDRIYAIKEQERISRDNRRFGVSLLSSILGFVLVLLLTFYIVRVGRGSTNLPTFTSFLSLLSNLEVLDVSTIIGTTAIGGDWGILDVIREFLNKYLLLPLEYIAWFLVM